MPVYQDKQTKHWYFRTYANNSFGERKQYQKGGFRTKKEALEAESNFKATYENMYCDLTFKELWNIYKEYIGIKLKYNSYRTIVNRIEIHALPYFGDYHLKDIKASIYVRWQKIMDDKGYSYKYKSSIHGAIRTMLNYGIKFYELKSNIASEVGNFSKRDEIPKEYNIWSYEEFKKFISVVDNDMYNLLFKTLYFTGLRQGEALALTWKDLQDNYLIVNKTLTRKKENGKNVVNSPKTTKSNRKVKIDNRLLDSFKEFKEKCHKFVEFDDSWYIFGCLKPLATTTIARKKDKYCALAGVKKIKIHDFRHSHVSLLLSKGVPITVIAKRLGHSDIEMTLNTYSHLLPGDEDKAINVLDNLV